MIVPYDLDSAKSKQFQGKALAAKDIILMPVNVLLGVVKVKLVSNCGVVVIVRNDQQIFGRARLAVIS
jgi:hypothetical protein